MESLKLPKEDEERESDEEVVDENKVKVSSTNCSEEMSRDQSFQSETLVIASNSEDMDVKPTITSTSLASLVTPELKIEQFGSSKQEVIGCVTPQAQAQLQGQAEYSYSSTELLPVPIQQSLSSSITPTPLPAQHHDNNSCTLDVNQQNSSQQILEPAHALLKTPSLDEYNWRKYGQKPVKNNNSSRSYYRCTYINCHAKKKVERCDQSDRVIEIVYKGGHTHDPPQKIRRTEARICSSTVGAISSPEPGEGIVAIDCPPTNLDSPSTPRRKLKHASSQQKLHSSEDCASNDIVKNEVSVDISNAKRRFKGQSVEDSLYKTTVKEPKIVVQASGDVGVSGDGYRWRKYGQKMVKGNSNPRSYYKCTSAGCPVRKHVERATDDTTFMISYEGKHDHDMPVPKKNQDPPIAALVSAATSMNNAQLQKCEPLMSPISSTQSAMDVASPKSSTQLSMDVEREVASEKTSEIGPEKALESARTLLSIGIELRPC
ncbi:Wrky transcription factor wrky24 [Thalictrum thalictroides]|uniref:Wrky transcription factor wrky24 n=1 Tax=Thalictrum thalictroides TaxID=46969 RepID=A0A7J6X7W3_THATH|nr:Wrky transcription factor wrky24 [Thalictrum thalictroides]